MQDLWKKFVYPLIDAQKKDMDEETYHGIVEMQLQLLGWASYMGEICHKENIPIGNNNSIQPDILVKLNGEVQFVIEVKRPVHELTDRERIQLESYMRQLKIEVGVYIGDHIEVIYDKPKSKEAITVLALQLNLEEKRGSQFVDLFSKENFSREEIIKFCEDRLIQIKKQADLNKIKDALVANANSIIAESLTTSLIDKYGESFSRDEIKKMLSTVKFNAFDEQEQDRLSNAHRGVNAENSISHPSKINCYLTRKCDAHGIFDIHKRTLIVTKGSVINSVPFGSFKGKDLERREKLIKEHTIYNKGELMVDSDILFDSPSGAAVFCIGGAANGWTEWQDERGNRLDIYRNK